MFRTPIPRVFTIPPTEDAAVYYIPHSSPQAPDDDLGRFPAIRGHALLRRIGEQDDWFQTPEHLTCSPPTATAERMSAHNAHPTPTPTARHSGPGNSPNDELMSSDNTDGDSNDAVSPTSRFSCETHPPTGWPGQILVWRAKRKIVRIVHSSRTHVRGVLRIFERVGERVRRGSGRG